MDTVPPKRERPPGIEVLRCLAQECRALLAYEVDAEGFLYVDLAWTAHKAEGWRYFPCPRCGGKNVVEMATDSKGRERPRAARFVH